MHPDAHVLFMCVAVHNGAFRCTGVVYVYIYIVTYTPINLNYLHGLEALFVENETQSIGIDNVSSIDCCLLAE